MTLNHRDLIARMGVLDELREAGGGVREHVTVDWMAGRITTTVWLPGGAERVFHLRLYTATELVELVSDAGFTDVRALGAFDGRPVSPTDRLVVTARRG